MGPWFSVWVKMVQYLVVESWPEYAMSTSTKMLHFTEGPLTLCSPSHAVDVLVSIHSDEGHPEPCTDFPRLALESSNPDPNTSSLAGSRLVLFSVLRKGPGGLGGVPRPKGHALLFSSDPNVPPLCFRLFSGDIDIAPASSEVAGSPDLWTQGTRPVVQVDPGGS